MTECKILSVSMREKEWDAVLERAGSQGINRSELLRRCYAMCYPDDPVFQERYFDPKQKRPKERAA